MNRTMKKSIKITSYIMIILKNLVFNKKVIIMMKSNNRYTFNEEITTLHVWNHFQSLKLITMILKNLWKFNLQIEIQGINKKILQKVKLIMVQYIFLKKTQA